MRRALEDLATFHGVSIRHWDGLGREAIASDEALLATLRALGVPIDRAADADAVLRRSGLAAWERPVEPAGVAWDGKRPAVRVRVPEARLGGAVRATVALEGGESSQLEARLDALPLVDRAVVEGQRFVEVALELGAVTLPPGRHRVTLELGGAPPAHHHLFAAPRRAFVPAGDERGWGVFVPLYALHSARSQGVGDLSDLARLVQWVKGLGGHVVGTLPLLPTFLGESGPFDPSPYAPVSRLFWNEVFLDVDRLPELATDAEARAARAAPGFEEARGALGAGRLVDWRAAMALKRRVIEPCAAAFFAAGGAREPAFRAFLEAHPRATDYARFRAATEAYGAAWHVWPDEARAGDLTHAEVDDRAVRTHLYAQFRTAEQAAQVAGDLYLDLPLGVHPDGYDAYRMRELFLGGVSAGAPPDELFTKGQDWGFRPLHPHTNRAAGHTYFAECLRHPMAASRILRIDHVMGLHRVYCVPLGMEAHQGVYVRFPAEEHWAVLALESVRHGTRLMGEDLGTVPDAVREAMADHGALRTFVLQFGFDLSRDPPVQPVPEASVASVNTHDVPTFAAFWGGYDLALWHGLGLMSDDEVETERERRAGLREGVEAWVARRPAAAPPGEVLDALLEVLGASAARYVMVTLEDLWAEVEPQNVPGTSSEVPNWKRRAAWPLERIVTDRALAERLRALARARRDGPTA